MTIRFKFLSLVLTSLIASSAIIGTFLYSVIYFEKIEDDKASLLKLQSRSVLLSATFSRLFKNEDLSTVWIDIEKNSYLLLNAYQDLQTLNHITDINDELADIILDLRGLEVLNSSYFFQLVDVYVSLKLSLYDMDLVINNELSFSDLYRERISRTNPEWSRLKYHIDSFLESYILYDNIQSNTISLIDNKIREIEKELSNVRRNFVVKASTVGIIAMLISLGMSLWYSKQFSKDVQQVAAELNTMIKEGKARKISTISTGDMEDLAKNVVSVFEQLVYTKDQLAQSERIAAMGTLTAGIAHQLNTPLGIIITAASHKKNEIQTILDMIRKEKISKEFLESEMEQTEQGLSLILDNAERSGKLVTSFKELALSPGEGKKQNVPIHNICEVLPSYALHLKHGDKVRFEFNYPKQLSMSVRIDEILQIFQSLIENSIIHGFNNQKDAVILISFNTSEKGNLIQYRDNGSGIEQQFIKRIFEPFYGTAWGIKGGVGLGLSKVFNLVKYSLKGNIKCTDSLEKGVEFIIDFPDEE